LIVDLLLFLLLLLLRCCCCCVARCVIALLIPLLLLPSFVVVVIVVDSRLRLPSPCYVSLLRLLRCYCSFAFYPNFAFYVYRLLFVLVVRCLRCYVVPPFPLFVTFVTLRLLLRSLLLFTRFDVIFDLLRCRCYVVVLIVLFVVVTLFHVVAGARCCTRFGVDVVCILLYIPPFICSTYMRLLLIVVRLDICSRYVVVVVHFIRWLYVPVVVAIYLLFDYVVIRLVPFVPVDLLFLRCCSRDVVVLHVTYVVVHTLRVVLFPYVTFHV